MKQFYAAVFLSVVTASVAMAEENPNTASAVVEGAASAASKQTLVRLAATESEVVAQDVLVASLRIEVEEKGAADVQEKINTAMAKALEISKGVASVKASTGGYSVYRVEREKGEKTWQGAQSLELRSTDAAAVLALAGKVQGLGFVTSGLSYTLSPEKAEQVKDGLLVAALKKVQAKAALIGKTLGSDSYRLTEVTVDGASPSENEPMPMRAMAAKMENGSTPSAAAGESVVALTVQAKAVLGE